MTLEIQKGGGPYTTSQREERRKKVYDLYFTKSLSAVQIANQLKINRNTINEDIKYWNEQIAEEIGITNLAKMTTKEIHILENQRKRLLEYLDFRRS